ncbi:MAG: hypothetical protein ACRDKE_12290 [Solirubrobacterales bacterium]
MASKRKLWLVDTLWKSLLIIGLLTLIGPVAAVFEDEWGAAAIGFGFSGTVLVLSALSYRWHQSFIDPVDRTVLFKADTRENIVWGLLVLIPFHVGVLAHHLELGWGWVVVAGIGALTVGYLLMPYVKGELREGDLVTLEWFGGYRWATVVWAFEDEEGHQQYELAVFDPPSMERPESFDAEQLRRDWHGDHHRDAWLGPDELLQARVKVKLNAHRARKIFAAA